MSYKHNQIPPIVYARKFVLHFDPPCAGSLLVKKLEAFLSGLVVALHTVGVQLIGHIKGKLDAGEDESIFFSATSFDRPPILEGHLKLNVASATMILNIIVFGIEQHTCEHVVLDNINKYFPYEEETRNSR